ncbi:hypothetical protein HY041_00330 [Candidatus Roizmanbacteria bacterium]|nr:hypothetical protein [Candidatus Roizmanbacteria bacterium]
MVPLDNQQERNNDHRRHNNHRNNHSRDNNEDDEEEQTDRRPTRSNAESGVPNFNQLTQAINAVLGKVQNVEQTLTEKLSRTETAVLELDKKIKKEEPKSTEEPARATEPAPKPTTTVTPATTTSTTPAEKPKSFLESLGDGIKKIGEIPGKFVRAGVGIILSPVLAVVKVLEGFWDGLTKPLFPKKTS